jgi:hypothetical protein
MPSGWDFTPEQRPFAGRRQAQVGWHPRPASGFTDFSAAFTEWLVPAAAGGGKLMAYAAAG